MEASIGMVFQVCFWERRKLQVVAACASKPVAVRYFLLHEVLSRSRFATEICIMANGIGFGGWAPPSAKGGLKGGLKGGA